MKTKWFEHMKTAALVILVSISFVLTGLLWYSSPSYEEKKFARGPEYIFSEKFNKKAGHQLASPYQMIIHEPGKTTWTLPEDESYHNILKTVKETILDAGTVTSVSPKPEDWHKLFTRATGVELQFPRDVTVPELDAFFSSDALREYPQLPKKISRVWFFRDPGNGQDFIWFISDQKQQVIQVQPESQNDTGFTEAIAQADTQDQPALVPVPVNGKNPADPANSSQPFSRVLYLPAEPLQINQPVYALDNIDIENMKGWLFLDPDIEPIIYKNNEYLYTYDEQVLTYNKQGNFMIYKYNDTGNRDESETLTMTEELSQINDFVQRHRGWPGNYLLDKFDVEENNFPQYTYTFRLFKQGYPVYWGGKSGHVTPDQIQLQSGGRNGASKYIRSMYYLSEDQPIESTVQHLPGKEQLLQILAQKKINLASIEHIFPGYHAQPQTIKGKKQVNLKPVWVVITQGSQTPTLIPSP
ncbi:YycH family regulatory protein [Paenactinomyces guangxiensis]|uniref:Regulatory protein YycH domain-containing protein n=1 Tax=Paenactinomyces guangxiensis TaxID=1490290 RepID=A0A7W1WQ80_9BACL|nr:two-component system activity regulator YycH [Paenactinomyces guangxiensis]MBA4494078.1 hypothetical protein [Paenactinomyces guangxiensis]MBH8591177.1 hypothetical protein [Paenactinomyces guangxiensis]